MSVFICDCGKHAPTQRERRVDDCWAHVDGVHVFVERREQTCFGNTLAICPLCGGYPALCNCP